MKEMQLLCQLRVQGVVALPSGPNGELHRGLKAAKARQRGLELGLRAGLIAQRGQGARADRRA